MLCFAKFAHGLSILDNLQDTFHISMTHIKFQIGHTLL